MCCDILGPRDLEDLEILSSAVAEEVLSEWLHPPIRYTVLVRSIEVCGQILIVSQEVCILRIQQRSKSCR